MKDPTEDFRRAMIETEQPYADCVRAERRLTIEQMREEYGVIGFAAPFVVVRRKSDGAKGSLEFTHSPRFYFNWMPHEEKS